MGMPFTMSSVPVEEKIHRRVSDSGEQKEKQEEGSAGRPVGADLVPEDQVLQQAQDQLGAAVHDVLGDCNDSHVMVRMRVIGVSHPAKRYGYLKVIHDEK